MDASAGKDGQGSEARDSLERTVEHDEVDVTLVILLNSDHQSRVLPISQEHRRGIGDAGRGRVRLARSARLKMRRNVVLGPDESERVRVTLKRHPSTHHHSLARRVCGRIAQWLLLEESHNGAAACEVYGQ